MTTDKTATQFGEKQVALWRRSYDLRPPQVEEGDPRFPLSDPRYADVLPSLLPRGESLEDTEARVLPIWHERIAPQIRAGKRILIAAHGNSLRALVHYLDGVDRNAITALNIPTGLPLIYRLNDDLKPIEHHYLEAPAKPGDAERKTSES